MIYHIVNSKVWENSKSEKVYKADSLITEGFIHCSSFEKIEESANKFFKGQTKLVVLCINEKTVNAEIVWEDLYDTGYNYPHIYGPLNLNSVVKVLRIEYESNGEFKIEGFIK